jgi:hypothetical protein
VNHAAAALDKGFAHTHRSALAPFKEKTLKNRQKPQKTCGNRAFAVDKVFQKPQGKRRWVLSEPHKHWVSRLLPEGARAEKRESAERGGSGSTLTFPAAAKRNQEEIHGNSTHQDSTRPAHGREA